MAIVILYILNKSLLHGLILEPRGSELLLAPWRFGLQLENVMTLMVVETLTTMELPGNAVELRGGVVAKDAETMLLVSGPIVRVLCLPRVAFYLLQPSSPVGAIVGILSQMTLASAAVTPASLPWLSWLIL